MAEVELNVLCAVSLGWGPTSAEIAVNKMVFVTRRIAPTGGCNRGALGVVSGVKLIDERAEFLQASNIRIRNAAPSVRGDVQEQDRISADGFEIDVSKRGEGFDLAVLGRVVKPAGANRDIAFCRVPPGLVFLFY